MVKLNWDGNDFRNSQDSSSTVADNISRKGNLQQGYNHGSLTRGLIAYYPMEKGEGEVLHDGAMDNLGQINGANWAGSGSVGKNSLNFDGNNDYVSVTDSIPLRLESTQLVFSFWVKARNPGVDDWQTLIGKRKPDSWEGYAIQITPDSHSTPNQMRIYADFGQGGSQFVTDKEVKTDEWEHYALTYDGSTWRWFIDGNLANSTEKGSLSSWNGDLWIGTGHYEIDTDSEYFDGILKDMRIYNRVLSQPEIEALASVSQPSGVERIEKSIPGQSEGGISRYKLHGEVSDSWSDNNGTNNGVDLTATGVYGQAAKFEVKWSKY